MVCSSIVGSFVPIPGDADHRMAMCLFSVPCFPRLPRVRLSCSSGPPPPNRWEGCGFCLPPMTRNEVARSCPAFSPANGPPHNMLNEKAIARNLGNCIIIVRPQCSLHPCHSHANTRPPPSRPKMLSSQLLPLLSSNCDKITHRTVLT